VIDMTDGERPIQLEYKTPEKGERISAWMVIKRVTYGFAGIFALIFALACSCVAISSLVDLVSQRKPYSELGGVFFLPLTYMGVIGWIVTIRWLKYAIRGD